MAENYSAATQPTPIASPGATLGTDWEQRVDFARLRTRARGQGPRRPGAVGSGRADLVRHEQHPVHHRHPHRELGEGQAVPLCPRHARPGPDPVGHRVGGPHPPEVRAVERQGELAGRHLQLARLDPRGGGRRARQRQADRRHSPRSWPGRRAGRGRRGGAAGAAGPGAGRPAHRGRPRVHAGHPRHQDRGRGGAARPRGRPGRRRLRRALPLPAGGHPGEQLRRPGQPLPLRERVGGGGGHQLDLRRAVQPASARVLRPPDPARATPRTSTSSIPSTATGPATTGR